MPVQGRTVKERQQRQREIDERYANTLRQANDKKEKRQPKRQSVDVLQHKIITDITDEHIIRPMHTYPNRSYNQDKQVVGLIRHLYVKYPVPHFMYDVVRKDYKTKFKNMHADYIMWFLALAQGKSFTKLVKPYMTSKEAYHFLFAPYTEIGDNIWWAKLVHAGIPKHVTERLVERVFKGKFYADETGRYNELIHFYANHYAEMDKITFDAVNDFIVWKLANDAEFRFKGRTATSMIKMSNEWHEMMQKAKLGRHVEWEGCGIPDWIHIGEHEIWTMEELLNNKELANEGRKQKHCVYGYVNACIGGSCHIFSLRGWTKGFFGLDADGQPIYRPVSELYRVTVEMRGRELVQVRIKLNQTASTHELNMLRLWAGEKGVRMSSTAFTRRW